MLEEMMLWTKRLLAFSIIIQSIELISLRHYFSRDGVWTISILKKDFEQFPKVLNIFLNTILEDKIFFILNCVRFISAVTLAVSTYFKMELPLVVALIWYLYLSTLLITIRFRGSFNGGSDFMTIIVSSALAFSTFYPPSNFIFQMTFAYIAILTCLSYVLAGLVKIRGSLWRNGQALNFFFHSPNYPHYDWMARLTESNLLAKFLSWFVIFFQLAFPLVLFSEQFKFFILISFLFHLANFFFFGLNRFLLAWMCTYPALWATTFKI